MVSVALIREPESYETGLRQLLETVDEEFVPPLTGESRESVSREEGEGGRADIDGYVERCLNRPLVGVVDTEIVGILSFKHLQDASNISGYTPSNHVEILAVTPERRGEGLGSRMYRYLLEELPPSYQQPYVSTKTWDGNEAHIKILERFNFEQIRRIADDRSPGVDTVYYARPRAMSTEK